MSVYVLSTFLSIDGQTSGEKAPREISGLRTIELEIQSLGDGWEQKSPRHFKSGAAPVFAAEYAQILIESEQADRVIISGVEPLRSGYERGVRNRLMDVYDGVSIPEGYTRIAHRYLDAHEWSTNTFRSLARVLEANYRRTATNKGLSTAIKDADAPVTDLFRRVDCANPVIDFSGELVVGNSRARDNTGGSVQLVRSATSSVPDGPDHVAEIATYEHLADVIDRATAGYDLRAALSNKDAAIELYTCFPIVPLAFLRAAGWADSPDELREFLETHEITVSGGMNFARAPWNNPALHALILVVRQLEAGRASLGLVHGNGGLGGWQGVTLLAA